MLIILTGTCLKTDIGSSIAPVLNKEVKNSVGQFKYLLCPNSSFLGELKNDDVLLVCGTENLKWLQSINILPKGRRIASLREVVFKYKGCNGLVSYSPALVRTDHQAVTDLIADVRSAIRLHQYKTIVPPVGDYKYVSNFKDAISKIQAMHDKTGKKIPIVVDIETLGLDPYSPSGFIVCISLSYMKGTAEVVYLGSRDRYTNEIKEDLGWLLNCPYISTRGSNFKFDQAWFFVHLGVKCSNFTMDTTIVGSLLDENRSNSLTTHAKVYTEIGGYDTEFNKKYDKSKMDTVPLNDMLHYSGGDADAAYRVAEEQVKELKKLPDLSRFYIKLLHPAARALEGVEYEGVCVDVNYFAKLGAELSNRATEIEHDIFKLFPAKLKIKYRDDLALTRLSLLKDYMFTSMGLNLKPHIFTEKTNQPTMSMTHLNMYLTDPAANEFIQLLNELKALQKAKSTYVDGFMEHLRSDGKFHPSYIVYKGGYGGGGWGDEAGTVTGRLSAKDPAIQTLPKHSRLAKELRKGYVAPPGFKIANWDFSQGELRITACLANEPTMIASYKKGFDMHLETGAYLSGLSPKEAKELKKTDVGKYDLLRQGGKAGNFGLIYGMGAGGYVRFAWNKYQVKLTLEEASSRRSKFFELYPKLLEWHENSIQFARRHKCVVTPLGRIRHLPLIGSSDSDARSKEERRSINSPVQATLSDLGLWALSEFRRIHGEPEECRFFMTNHDAIVAYVSEDKVDYWVPEVARIMQTLPMKMVFGWEPQLAFPVDAEVGYNLAEMNKFPLST